MVEQLNLHQQIVPYSGDHLNLSAISAAESKGTNLATPIFSICQHGESRLPAHRCLPASRIKNQQP
jgi:hypothetical protein